MTVDEANAQVTLHDEAIEELGLNDQPFIDNKKRSRFTDSTSQRTSATLEQHLRFGEPLHLFLGEAGVGKTVFLSQLLKTCKSSIKPFVAKGADNFEAVAFLAAVLNQLGGEPAESISDHVDALIPLFEDLAEEKLNVILAIDDAHLAPIEEIAELIDIMPSFTIGDEKNARLLLVAEPRLKDELSAIADEFEDLTLDHATTVLEPMDTDRVRGYLTNRLNQVGHTDVFPFTDKSVEKIHHDSSGLPGRINPLAAKYLNNVYAGGVAPGSKGLLAALGWPILAMGAAAVALIAWGLSMFISDDAPEASIAANDVVVTEPSSDIALVPEQTDTVVSSVNTDTVTPETSVTVNDATLPMVADNAQQVIEEDDGLVLPEDLPDAANDLATDVTPTLEETIVATVEAEPTAPITEDLVVEAPAVVIDEPVETETIIANVNATTTTEPEPVVIVPEPTAQPVIVQAPKKVTAADRKPEPLVPESVVVDITDTQNAIENTIVSTATTEPVSVAVAIAVDSAPTSSGAVAVDTGAAGSNGVVVTVPELDADTAQSGSGTRLATDQPPAVQKAIENERWVLFQAPTKFTVQLATSRERNYIIELAQALETENPVAIYPFLTTNSKNPVFGLLAGLYETRTEAIEAVANMQPATKQFGVWIRPISDLQAAIKNKP